MSKMSPQMRIAVQRREFELAKALQKPKRKAMEDAFEQLHSHDSDDELLDYVMGCYLERGDHMQRAGFVGIRYLEQRLGCWSSFMPRVKRRIRELNSAQQTELSEEPKSDVCR